MAQDDSAAKEILGWRNSLGRAARKLDSWNQPSGKQDTSWHDSMVRQANEGFRKQAEESRQAAVKAPVKTSARRTAKASPRTKSGR